LSVVPFELPSTVNFDSLREVRAAGERYIDQKMDQQTNQQIGQQTDSLSDQNGDAMVFDLSPLQECNSAAVALLMAWVRYAHAQGKTVVYVGAPADLLNIIEVTGLSQTLPIQK
jgi:ABC-type transporter Mla MlaB component